MPTNAEGKYLQDRPYSPKDSLFMFLLCNSLQGSTNIIDYAQNIKAANKQEEAIKILQTNIVVLSEQIKTPEKVKSENTFVYYMYIFVRFTEIQTSNSQSKIDYYYH